MSTTIYSAIDAARRIGCDPVTIRRHCAARGIGTRLGRDWALTDSDLDALRKIVRPGPGNPNAVEGNSFFRPPAVVASPSKSRASARQKKRGKK